MYLRPEQVQSILSSIQMALTNPVAILSMDWLVLGTTTPTLKEKLDSMVLVCKQDQQLASSFGADLFCCRVLGEDVCRVVVFGTHAELFRTFISQIIVLTVGNNGIVQAENAQLNMRTMLTNQLANSSKPTTEILGFLSDLSYRPDISRCAILFHLDPKPLSAKLEISWFEQNFSRIINDSGFQNPQDIYGPLNSEHYLVFKATRTTKEAEIHKEISDFVHAFRIACQSQFGFSVQATAGTFYPRVDGMKNSYEEAAFLQNQYRYLHNHDQEVLFLDCYIYEYLNSLLPKHFLDNAFQHINAVVDRYPLLLETITALSKNDTNLTFCANDLHLHRNTLLMRYAHLKERLGMDPVHRDTDRLNLRSYALYRSQKLNLHVGIMIQPHSVLHQGMERFAQIVEKESQGNIVLDIHTLSTSGDNSMVFNMLCQGALDFVICSTSVMNEATAGRSAVMELPFLFDSYEQAQDVLERVVLPDIEESLTGVGAKCLAIWSMGWRYITTNWKPIHVPSDLAGLRFRIMFNNTMETYCKMIGAIPIKMNYNAIAKAFETGLIDGQENPANNILEMGFANYQQYITVLNYNFSTEGCFISRTIWEKLSEVQRKLIVHAMRKTTEWIYQMQDSYNKQCLDTLIKGKGLIPVYLTKEEIEKWKDSVRPLYSAFEHQDLIRKIRKAAKLYAVKPKSN